MNINEMRKLLNQIEKSFPVVIPPKEEIAEPFKFYYNTFQYNQYNPPLIARYPEWVSFDKNKIPENYWYIFDFEKGMISAEFRRNPKTYAYDELRNLLEARVGSTLYKHGKYWLPDSYENYIKIFQNFPENRINKFTLRFKARLVFKVNEFIKFYEIRSKLNQINLSNVDEHFHEFNLPENGQFKNQKIGLIYTSNFMPFALLWEMGTGKTRTAIETFIYYKSKGEVDKCLVICPLSVIDNWVDEIIKWSDCTYTILRGNKIELLDEVTDFYIINYESVPKFEVLKQFVDHTTMIICDESTKVKNPQAKRSRAVISLGKKTKYKLIMTGTPVTQHAYDLWSPFAFLDGGETFGLSFQKFIDKYYFRNGFKLIPKNGSLEKISNRMYMRSLRFLKKDCIDIPDKLYTNRIVELPPYNRQKYDEMLAYCITQIEQSEKVTANVILTQLLRLSQITSGFVVDETGKEINFKENPKLDELNELLNEIDGKVIIWCRFQRDVKNILDLFKKRGEKAVSIYGETKVEERTRNIKDFQERDVKAIIGTAGTGGLGINLTAGNTVIYYSNSYSLQDRLQSEDRTHRIGQTQKVNYIDIIAKDTIDVSIYKLLRQKKNIADIITKDNIRSFV